MSDDIGPVPDASSGEPTRKQDATETSRVPADAGESPVETSETTTDETNTKTPPLVAPVNLNGPPLPPNGDQSPPPPRTGADKCWTAIDYSKPRETVEGAITECMKMKYGETLVTDVEGAELLLSYVTRNGLQKDKNVDDAAIQNLISARERIRTGLFDTQKEEANFRKSYGAIAKAADPVTVVSLRDSTMRTAPFRPWLFGSVQRDKKISEIACLVYRRWAFVVLVLLLVGQIYWTATSSVLHKTEAIIADLNKAPTADYYIARENEKRFASWAKLNPAAAAALAQATASASPAPTPNGTKPDKDEITLDELTSKVSELEANYSILGKLISPFRWFYFEREESSQKNSDSQKTKENQNAVAAPSPAETGPPAKRENDRGKTWTEPPAKADEIIFRPSQFQSESASKSAVAGQVIDVMQKWFLPLLYGALGAMVFVVRTLAVQARDRLFREEARVTLVLRVFLGMISGLAIGWFWTSGSQPSSSTGGPISISTLSPFALAFVAGYAVELFFALLDKIVSTFTNK